MHFLKLINSDTASGCTLNKRQEKASITPRTASRKSICTSCMHSIIQFIQKQKMHVNFMFMPLKTGPNKIRLQMIGDLLFTIYCYNALNSTCR